MKTDGTLKKIGNVRNSANEFIMEQLKNAGFSDIVPSHGHILLTLYKYEECTMTDISNNIQKDRSTVTALVNKLIKLGYVSSKKDSKDSRVTIVFLTEKGEEFKEVFKEVSQELNTLLYKGISETEKEEFLNILEKMYKNFKKK